MTFFSVSLSDAGASPTRQASQHGSGGQLDKPAQIFENTLELMRQTFKEVIYEVEPLYIVMDLERISLIL